jgi:hypothetical protein
VVIVASILLAFGIEAWWDGRRERENEVEILQSIRTEMQDNLLSLQGQEDSHRLWRDSALELLEVARSQAPLPSDQVMDSLVFGALITAFSWNPSQGAITSALSSGGLALVQNSELRAMLASWSGLIDDLVEDEFWVFRDVQERWMPYLQERIPLAGPIASSTDDTLGPEEVDALRRIGQASGVRDYGVLRGDLTLENFLVLRADAERLILRELNKLSDWMEGVIGLIDEELGGA